MFTELPTELPAEIKKMWTEMLREIWENVGHKCY